jgi:hypothetical protein
LPEGSGIVLWRVRDDVEVEFEAMVGSWGLDISTWSQTKEKTTEMGKKERLKDLGNMLRQ